MLCLVIDDQLHTPQPQIRLNLRPITSTLNNLVSSSSHTQLLIPLEHDRLFFSQLQHARNLIKGFCATEHKLLRLQLETLCRAVSTTLDAPKNRHARRSLYSWREVVGLWLQLAIFDDPTEAGRGKLRVASEAQARWEIFKTQLASQDPPPPQIHLFVNFNQRLLELWIYAEMNSEAIRKLLKKHTKQTALPLDPPPCLGIEVGSAATVARLMACGLADRLVEVVPVLEAYECPICMDIAYKPVRMRCGHRFCVRCLVKLQRAVENRCPVCRRPVVLDTTPRSSLSLSLTLFDDDCFFFFTSTDQASLSMVGHPQEIWRKRPKRLWNVGSRRRYVRRSRLMDEKWR